MERERERLEARNREIDDTFLSLYNDKVKGILSESRFLKLTDVMEREQGEIRAKLDEMSAVMGQVTQQEGDIQSFM